MGAIQKDDPLVHASSSPATANLHTAACATAHVHAASCVYATAHLHTTACFYAAAHVYTDAQSFQQQLLAAFDTDNAVHARANVFTRHNNAVYTRSHVHAGLDNAVYASAYIYPRHNNAVNSHAHVHSVAWRSFIWGAHGKRCHHLYAFDPRANDRQLARRRLAAQCAIYFRGAQRNSSPSDIHRSQQ